MSQSSEGVKQNAVIAQRQCDLFQEGSGGSTPTSPLHVTEIDFGSAASMIRDFHYLGDLPKAVRTSFGGWSAGSIEAVASYGPCHAPRLPAGVLELRRLVKRPGSAVSLSKFLSITARLLKARGVPALITWADPAHGHHGGIYQATNWIYNEPNSYNWNSHFRTEDGRIVDHREAYSRFGTSSKVKVLELNPGWTSFLPLMKYRYVLPLNIEKRQLIEAMHARELPYPKPNFDVRPNRLPSKFRPDYQQRLKSQHHSASST